MSGLLSLFLVLVGFNILDLPRHYAKSGDIKSAIRAYSEIYRTSNDSTIKYQAIFEQAGLYLKEGDTISAMVNLYRLQNRYLPDSLALPVFKMLFNLDRARLGRNALLFAKLYPGVRNRRRILEKLLKQLDNTDNRAVYLKILKILSSDYGGSYKSELSEYVYKNNLDSHAIRSLFDVNSKAPYFYYMHKNDIAQAFYTLFGRSDSDSRKLRLKILYNLGAYKACYNLISTNDRDPELVKLKVLSAVKNRMSADSLIKLIKSYKRSKKTYDMLVRFLDTLSEYGILRAYAKGDVKGIIYHGMRITSGLKDTIFLKTAIKLTEDGEYALARELIKSVKNYYPSDSVEVWKRYILKRKQMPQDILLSNTDVMGKVKSLYDNGYYAELVQYAKGKELPKQAVPYLTESLYMLWKLYQRRGYLKSAFTLAEKYKALIPRQLYLEIVYAYAPSRFDVERYNYGNLTNREFYLLYLLLKAQGKVKIVKDFSTGKLAKYLYSVSQGIIDSSLYYLPQGRGFENFYGLFFNEIVPKTRDDSLKILRRFERLSFNYLRSPSKSIVKELISYAIDLNDFFGADSLLNNYAKYYGKDRFYAYNRAKWYYELGEYKWALLYSLFYSNDRFQTLTAASLLKLGRIDEIGNLTLDRYARNLLYLRSGMLQRVNPALLDESDAAYYLKELSKSYTNRNIFKKRLSAMIKEGVVDSMTYTAYLVYFGYLNRDSVFLNSYGKSLLVYLRVKKLMRQNLLDSALVLIGNPANYVDSFKSHLYFKKGTILYMKKQYKAAYKNYLEAQELESLKDAALFNAYLSAKRANMKREVVKLLNRYISECVQCQKLPDAYISLGFNYLELGEPDSAISVLSGVEGYFSRDQEAELKYWLGTAYMQDSLFMEAEGYFSRVYRFHQKNGQWGDTGGLSAARLSFVLGLKDRAKKIYNSIIRRRKTDALAQEAKKELSIVK